MKELFISLIFLFLMGCSIQTTVRQETIRQEQTPISSPVLESPSFSGYCCLDNALSLGSYQEMPCRGDDLNLENVPVEGVQSCKSLLEKKKYGYATLYQTTNSFAIVCTEGNYPCTLSDKSFFTANFNGYHVGMDALKKATGGIMPKKKIEFHLAQDDACFQQGYAAAQVGGYTYQKAQPFPVRIVCNTPYKWYLELQGTTNERTIAWHETLASQTLTIHEPIHIIFSDYTPKGVAPPSYVLQESIAKHVSLREVGTIKNYAGWLEYSKLTVDNPPNATSAWFVDFFVYSLNQRFGFNEDHMKQLFIRYAQLENNTTPGNQKLKNILDNLLERDTRKSFEDVGISVQ